MKLTPNGSAKQLPMWHCIWREANPDYFPLEKNSHRKLMRWARASFNQEL